MKRLMLVIVVAISLFASESEARCRRRLFRRHAQCCCAMLSDEAWVRQWAKSHCCRIYASRDGRICIVAPTGWHLKSRYCDVGAGDIFSGMDGETRSQGFSLMRFFLPAIQIQRGDLSAPPWFYAVSEAEKKRIKQLISSRVEN